MIDGADGAGKATQTKMLIEHLSKDGASVETLDFPQYTNNTFGKLIRECLDGKRGDFMGIDARIASTLYAADRFESKDKINKWLQDGKIVVLDRYVSSNMLHQGAKLNDLEEIRDFLSWLDHIEHEIFDIPRPDLIFYLDVPLKERTRLIEESVKNKKHGADTKVDLAEADIEHQEMVNTRSKDIINTMNTWEEIACMKGGVLRAREDIHEELYTICKKHYAF